MWRAGLDTKAIGNDGDDDDWETDPDFVVSISSYLWLFDSSFTISNHSEEFRNSFSQAHAHCFSWPL